jgi:hypothetical protein
MIKTALATAAGVSLIRVLCDYIGLSTTLREGSATVRKEIKMLQLNQ